MIVIRSYNYKYNSNLLRILTFLMLRNWSYYTATLNEMVVLVVIIIAMNLICNEIYTDLMNFVNLVELFN